MQTNYIIKTQYPGKCAEKLYNIGIGDNVLFDPINKKLYCQDSQKYKAYFLALKNIYKKQN